MSKKAPPSQDTDSKKDQKKEKTPLKRPPSAYILFSKDIRETVKSENPEMAPKQIIKEIARRWKELGEDQKAPFFKIQEELKQQYKEDKAAKPNNSPPKKRKTKEDPPKKKRNPGKVVKTK